MVAVVVGGVAAGASFRRVAQTLATHTHTHIRSEMERRRRRRPCANFGINVGVFGTSVRVRFAVMVRRCTICGAPAFTERNTTPSHRAQNDGTTDDTHTRVCARYGEV